MTQPNDFTRKIERSSLGTPVVRRIRARTAHEISNRIVQRALHRSPITAGEHAGITEVCLYSSLNAYEHIGSPDGKTETRRIVMAHSKTTGPKAASNAGKVLSNPKSSKAARSAAASALAQKHGKGKKR